MPGLRGIADGIIFGRSQSYPTTTQPCGRPVSQPRCGPDRGQRSPRVGAVLRYGGDMPETRYALFVLGVGAGFFIAMNEWVTMIAEAMP